MFVYLNDSVTYVPETCNFLDQLLELKGYNVMLLHITVNGREVPPTAAHDIILFDGMRIWVK